jgi:hypothetical protein
MLDRGEILSGMYVHYVCMYVCMYACYVHEYISSYVQYSVIKAEFNLLTPEFRI